jgi:hypothetical protein
MTLSLISFPEQLIMLEEEILALETHLIALKRKRNLCMPLCRLPSEIIVLILHHARRPLGPPAKRARMVRPNYLDFFILPGVCDFLYDHTWLNLTTVCSHIRYIALTTPALWSYIDIGAHDDQLVLHASRALSMPMVINLDNSERPAVSVANHLANAETVRVHRGNHVARLAEVSHNLKTLHVTGFGNDHHMQALYRMIPRLEELYFLEISPRAWPQDWGNLRRLCLDTVDIDLDTMQSMLIELHSLEDLAIIDSDSDGGMLYAADAGTGDASTSPRPGSKRPDSSPCLQRLRHITIIMGFSLTLALLRSIVGLRRSTHNITLQLDPGDPDRWSVDDPDRWSVNNREEHVVSLVTHILEVWNSAWTQMQALSATFEWHRYHLKGALNARLTATAQDGHRQSILLVPYTSNSDVHAMYTRYGVPFTALYVYATADFSPNTRKQLGELIETNAPHLQSITFYGISAAREVRSWFTHKSCGSAAERPEDTTLLDVRDVRFIDCDEEGEVSKVFKRDGDRERTSSDEGEDSGDED